MIGLSDRSARPNMALDEGGVRFIDAEACRRGVSCTATFSSHHSPLYAGHTQAVYQPSLPDSKSCV